MATTHFSSLQWAKVDLSDCPAIIAPPPGPQSCDYHRRCTKHFKGLSSQVKLFPVAFESGEGCVLVDVDGNRYIDFSSGIYVTTLGHCHPKVSEAVARYARQLMNAHDFTTPIKTRLVEKLAEVLPGDFSGFQFYDAGTAAVEAGMRVLPGGHGPQRDAQSCFNDFHGKTYGAVSLAQIRSPVYGRVRLPGAHMLPRPDPYRPLWTKPDGTIDTDQLPRLLRRVHREGHRGRRGRLRAGTDPGLGGLGHAARRFLPQAAQVLRRAEALCSWPTKCSPVGAARASGCAWSTGAWSPTWSRSARASATASRSPAWPCASRIKESFEKISASSSYGGNPMACAAALASTEVIEEENLLEHAAAPGRTGPAADGADEGRAPDRRRRAGQGLPDGHRAGQGPPHQGAFRRGRRNWSTRRRSARAWPGSRPATSCA